MASQQLVYCDDTIKHVTFNASTSFATRLTIEREMFSARCCQTLLLCDELPYRKCLFCNSLAATTRVPAGSCATQIFSIELAKPTVVNGIYSAAT